MKKNRFYVSFCCNKYYYPDGELTVDDQAVIYKTTQVTVPAEYWNLEMKYTDIGYIYTEKTKCFKTVVIHMKDSKNYKFIIYFGRKKFYELMKSKGVTVNT